MKLCTRRKDLENNSKEWDKQKYQSIIENLEEYIESSDSIGERGTIEEHLENCILTYKIIDDHEYYIIDIKLFEE